jgi:type IV secretory pathway component VirB8
MPEVRMRRPTLSFDRRLLSAVFALTGIVLLLIALVTASVIPLRAHDDFGVLVQAQGGGMSHTANYPDVYRQMSAQRRMLQNAYVGGAGLVFLAVGVAGLVRRDE